MFNVIRNTVGIWLGGPVSMQGNGNGDGDGIGNSNGTFNGNGNGQCNGNHATQFWLGGPVSMQGSFFDLLTPQCSAWKGLFCNHIAADGGDDDDYFELEDDDGNITFYPPSTL